MLEEDFKEARRLLYVCRDLVGGPGSGSLLAHIDSKLVAVTVKIAEFESLAPYEQLMESAMHEYLVEESHVLGPIQALRGDYDGSMA